MTRILQIIEANAKRDNEKLKESETEEPTIETENKDHKKSKFGLEHRNKKQFADQQCHGVREMYNNSVLRFTMSYGDYKAVIHTFNALLMHSVVTELECYRIPYFGMIRLGKKRRVKYRPTNWVETHKQEEVVKHFNLSSLRYSVIVDWEHSRKVFNNPQRMLKVDLSTTTRKWMASQLNVDNSILKKIYPS